MMAHLGSHVLEKRHSFQLCILFKLVITSTLKLNAEHAVFWKCKPRVVEEDCIDCCRVVDKAGTDQCFAVPLEI